MLAGLAGLSGTVASTYWLWLPLTRQYGLSPPAAALFVLGVAVFVALFYVPAGALLSVSESGDGRLGLLSTPAIWVAAEWSRARLGAGIAWLFAGHALAEQPWLSQAADLAGVYGLSALVVFTNKALLEGLRRRDWRAPALGLVALGLTLGYGAWRLASVRAAATGPALNVALVQPGIPQAEKWSKAAFPRHMEQLTDATAAAARGGPLDLVVWPETALTLDLQVGLPALRPALDALAPAGASLLLGAPRVAGDSTERWAYNSAALLRHGPSIVGLYDKEQLLPLGEYYPTWIRALPWLHRSLAARMGSAEFRPGSERSPLRLGSWSLGVVICYEVIDPALVARRVAAGADLLVNLTNDAWFEDSAGARQHLLMARLRAVEQRVPLLRAANTGISAVVLPDGSVAGELGLGRRGVLRAGIQRGPAGSLYGRWGDWFPATCGLAALGLALAAGSGALRKRRASAGS